jgi:phosphoribosylformylglycinamidine cyclo-ligase
MNRCNFHAQLIIGIMKDAQKYALRGVSATKQEVHNAIQRSDKGLYPTAFCKILPDLAAQDKDFCNIMHADTAGTKTALAYLYWRETGDLSVWKGIVQDAIVMNLDDMACVGCTNDFILSSTVGRNKRLIPGEIIRTIIESATEFADKMRTFGVNIHLAGGETADVGDIVRTIDVGYTAFARMQRNNLVINKIQNGDLIVGFASDGKASYEDEYNGGMGCNGLTSARHDVLHRAYAAKYPETFDPMLPTEVLYLGNRKLTDTFVVDQHQLTRTYLPVLTEILKHYRASITGMIHNTGGGLTKVLKFVENRHIIKNNLIPTPPLFQLIQAESKTDWHEMYQVFNMGTRLEIYTDEKSAMEMIEIAAKFKIRAQIIGHVASNLKGERLTVESPYGNFEY